MSRKTKGILEMMEITFDSEGNRVPELQNTAPIIGRLVPTSSRTKQPKDCVQYLFFCKPRIGIKTGDFLVIAEKRFKVLEVQEYQKHMKARVEREKIYND